MIPNNQFWHSQLGAVGYTPILDTYTGAQAAYSLRKLRTAYAGNCIRVRRSDNNTLDIGFDGNEVDVAAATAFCGVGDGFIAIWYDQSGNGLDLTNGTLAQHPQIIASGAMITNGTHYSSKFPTATMNLKGSAVADWKFMHVSAHSIYMVLQAGLVANPSATYALMGTCNGTSANNGMYLDYQDSGGGDDKLNHFVGNASGAVGTSPVSNSTSNNVFTANTLHVLSVLCDPPDAVAAQRSKISIDLSPQINLNTNTAAINNVNPPFALQLGGYGNSSGSLVGYVSELIIYSSEQSTLNDAGIQTNMLDYYGIPAYP